MNFTARGLFFCTVMLVSSWAMAARLKFGCDDPADACATKSQATLKRRQDKIRKLYNDLIYPTPLAIISGQQSPDDLFEKSVIRGRVTPVGQFSDFEGVVEYFYGLAGAPGTRVENVTIKSLIAGDDKAAVQVDIFFCQLPAGGCDPTQVIGPTSFTLTQTGFFRFNGDDKIISFDLSILNLGAALDPLDSAQRLANIQRTCGLVTIGIPNVLPATCPTTFDDPSDYPSTFQFNSNLPPQQRAFGNCVAFMSTAIPYGSWNRANSNTFVCRELHSLLTPLRPQIHCPHTSPDGGHMCMDFPYASFYEEEF